VGKTTLVFQPRLTYFKSMDVISPCKKGKLYVYNLELTQLKRRDYP